MEFGFNRELYHSQRKFIADATETIKNNKIGIFSSPTGTGKTLSLLCTALNFIKKTDYDDLFALMNNSTKTEIYYCSRTHSQLCQVLNELKTNTNTYKTVILGSRKAYCINDKINKITDINILTDSCRALIKNDSCEFYETIYHTEDTLDIEDLKNRGKNEKFCPFYYSKNKASECSIVLLPYNLLFTKEGRKSVDIDLENKILIVDEAHNIYDVIIQMNSAEVSWQEIQTISGFKNLSDEIKTICKRILEFNKKTDVDVVMTVTDFIYKSKISQFNMFEIEAYISEHKIAQKNDFPAVFEFSKLLKLLTFSDDSGRVIFNKNKLRFTPLNPKIYFEEMKKCKSVIFAGGTMEPISQLKDIFPDILYFNYPSVNNNFLPLIIPETNTKKQICLNYEERGLIIDDLINTLVALSNPIQIGGIVIFVPSYNFLKILKSNPKTTQNFKRNVYFEDEISFEEYKKSPDILIAVMNGKLSEGINFSDDLCRLLIIVGVPYPLKTPEVEERCKFNKDYGTITAMKSVNQALGRALRHKNDYAALVLLDSRYNRLKDKLSPWIGERTKSVSFINGLIEITRYLKEKTNESCKNTSF